MQFIELLSFYQSATGGRRDVTKTLAFGRAISRILIDHKEIISDQDICDKLETLNEVALNRFLDDAEAEIKENAFTALGIAINETTADIAENHDITKENQKSLGELREYVPEAEKALGFLVKTIQDKPWEKMSRQQFLMSIGTSLIASIVVSLVVAFFGFRQQVEDFRSKLDTMEFVVIQFCEREELPDCPIK